MHPGPLSKTARSSEDAGHPDMCDTFVGSESEYISQSMCLSSNPTASEGSLAPRETSIIPKHRETSPGQVRVKTMWEMIKREGTLRIANPIAAGVPESKKPFGPLFVMVLLENEGLITMNMSWLIYNVLTASRQKTRTDAGLIYLFL